MNTLTEKTREFVEKHKKTYLELFGVDLPVIEKSDLRSCVSKTRRLQKY